MSFPKLANLTHAPTLCDTCFTTFDSIQQMAVHKFRAHGIKDPIRRFVFQNNTCPVCMKYFHNRERLTNHLRYRSHVCRINVPLSGPLFTSAYSDAIDVELGAEVKALHARCLRRHTTLEPVVVVPGLRLPVIIDPANFSKHRPLGNSHQYYS